MSKLTKSVIDAKGLRISIHTKEKQADYFSLTDIARYHSDDPTAVIQNWLRNRETIDFLGLWEQLNNSSFKHLEFEVFKIEAGRNSFTLSPKKWIETTGAIGIASQSGRYGGTFAHVDIAMEFASWISPEFKLYIIKEYQRLKSDESNRLRLAWSARRELSKVNYRIHTDAIKEHLLPKILSKQQIAFVYATEADILNVALFGMTAKEWRDQNPEADGNVRDHSTIEQLIVLINLESMNAELIKQELSQSERLIRLNKMAIEQIRSIISGNSPAARRLKETTEQSAPTEEQE